MRLLNTRTWEMKEFISEDHVPHYLILSHTWGEDEVSFQQWEARKEVSIRHMQGYQKIKRFGKLARTNGFDWVWVDTCCIDKKSSAELSEAINSMFRWYQKALSCYAYLSDVQVGVEGDVGTEVMVRRSRWFTRGWTLQELIAPVNVHFYSADWSFIGTRTQKPGLISSITGIDISVLTGEMSLEDVSIARRMSWASARQTSRPEDLAYCLLGLFDVNMPLIYGEGRKAFRRLQELIMNSTNDQSLFAWGRIVQSPAEQINRQQKSGIEPIPWKPQHQRLALMGLFADSPADFKESAAIAPLDVSYLHHHSRQNPPVMVNKGVLITLVVFQTVPSVSYWDDPAMSQPTERELALLLCRHKGVNSRLIALVLHPWGDHYFSRTDELLVVDTNLMHIVFEDVACQRHLLPFRPFQPAHGDVLMRQWEASSAWTWNRCRHTRSGRVWRVMWGNTILRMERDAAGDEDLSFIYNTGNGGGFAVTLRRMPVQGDAAEAEGILGPFMVGVSPLKAVEMTSFSKHAIGRPNVGEGRLETLHGKPLQTPAFGRVMSQPSDTWELNTTGVPPIRVRVTRTKLTRGGDVDVLDFFME